MINPDFIWTNAGLAFLPKPKNICYASLVLVGQNRSRLVEWLTVIPGVKVET